MWDGWDGLFQASALAGLPLDSLPILSAGLEMLLAVDLEWERFLAAVEASQPGPKGRWPLRALDMKRPFLEAHFLLVAADNARDRLIVWAEALGDDGAREIVSALDVQVVKDFRNHQEHLEERFRGGRRQGKSRVPAPGDDIYRVAEGAEVFSTNNLLNRRFLMFGAQRIDLQAVAETAVRVASELLLWLQGRGGNPRIGEAVGRAEAARSELGALIDKLQADGILPPAERE